MKVQLTYKYRLYPTDLQATKIKKTCGCVRYVYNKLLEERTNYYRENKKWKKLDWKELEQLPFLEEIDSGALIWAQSSLEHAYSKFFHTERTKPVKYRLESISESQRDPGYMLMDTDLVSYPRFKKKKSSRESYTTPLPDFAIQQGSVCLPCIGDVKVKYHRRVPENAEVLSATILKNPSGKYFLLIKFYLPEVPAKKDLQTPLGVALAPGRLAIRSDGVPLFFRHNDPDLQERIEKAYQTLKRRKPGSKRYEKQREYLASLYEHRANQRKDDLHKAARQIANAADAVYMQQPSIHAQIRGLKSASKRAVLLDEASWTFSSFVQYKTRNEGKWFWSVPKQMLVYNLCSNCRTRLNLQDENRFTCPGCGIRLERYVNAARNLKNIGEQFILAKSY